jgi:hypothetical protein
LHYWLDHFSKKAANMFGISTFGVAIALVALAIAVLSVVSIRCGGKPKKRPEPWEKTEIMKQLLKLSERENSLVVKARSVQVRAPVSRRGMRPRDAQLKTHAKTTLPIRSKTN